MLWGKIFKKDLIEIMNTNTQNQIELTSSNNENFDNSTEMHTEDDNTSKIAFFFKQAKNFVESTWKGFFNSNKQEEVRLTADDDSKEVMAVSGQNQIKLTISESENLNIVKKTIEENADSNNLMDIARRICEHFGFKDSNGNLQDKTCLKALEKLASEGKIALPKGTHQTSKTPKPVCLEEKLPLPINMPKSVEEIENFNIKLVETKEELHTWNTIFTECGGTNSNITIGKTRKYLISCDNFMYGCISFGSSAINSENRDNWIGWDKEIKGKYRNLLCGMNIFIRPNVKIKGLEEKALNLVMKVFPKDYENRYDEKILLVERFVKRSDISRREIMEKCNWNYAGSIDTEWMYNYREFDPNKKVFTRGLYEFDNNLKFIGENIPYIYVLNENFREIMEIPSINGLGKRELTDHVNEDNWAETEIGENRFGDKRLIKSSISILDQLFKKITNNVCEASQGIKKIRDQVYNFISDKTRIYKNKKTDRTNDTRKSFRTIMHKHVVQTLRRCKNEEGPVIFSSDTKTIAYNTHPDCDGLRTVSKNGKNSSTIGLKLHHTIACSIDKTILGEVSAYFISEKDESLNGVPDPYLHPTEKESFKWVCSLYDVSEYCKKMNIKNGVYVADRECPSRFFFYCQRELECIDVVIKSKGDINVADTGCSIEKHMLNQDVKSIITVHIDKQNRRTNGSQRECKKARIERDAKFEVRFGTVEITPPTYADNKENIKLNCVYLTEIDQPKGEEKIKLCLLTTLKVETIEDVLKITKIYTVRWVIEELHRIFETTCNIDEFLNDSAERIKRLIGFYMIISWRIMLMLQLGRKDNNIPADIVLQEDKYDVLEVVAKSNYNQNITNISDANNVIGKIGGYTDQANSPLGYEVFARGYVITEHIVDFYRNLIDYLPDLLSDLIKIYIRVGEVGFNELVKSFYNEFLIPYFSNNIT